MAEPKITTTAEPLLLNAVRGEDVERPPVWLMRQAQRYMKVGLNRDLWITILMFMAHFLENLFRCLFYKTSITYTKKKKKKNHAFSWICVAPNLQIQNV